MRRHETSREVIGERRRRGAFLVEVVFALTVAVVVLMSLTMMVGHLHRAQRQMADKRATMRRLETAMSLLQNGAPAEKELVVKRLATSAPSGMAWIQVSTPKNEAPVHSLAGLVRLSDIPADAGAPGRNP